MPILNNYSREKLLISGHYCKAHWAVFSKVRSHCSMALFIPFANWCFGGEEVERDVVCMNEYHRCLFWELKHLKKIKWNTDGSWNNHWNVYDNGTFPLRFLLKQNISYSGKQNEACLPIRKDTWFQQAKLVSFLWYIDSAVQHWMSVSIIQVHGPLWLM